MYKCMEFLSPEKTIDHHPRTLHIITDPKTLLMCSHVTSGILSNYAKQPLMKLMK